MPEKYDCIIIGAGIGGLVCGCYLAKKNFKVLIIEQRDKPGGYCSSFEREGFRFDVGVHYLGGINNGTLGDILEDLDLKGQIKLNQFDPTDKIITPNSITYIRKNPLDTIKEFTKSFPKEKDNIKRFFNFILSESLSSLYVKTKNKTFRDLLDTFFDDKSLKVTLGLLSANLGTNPSYVLASTMLVMIREFILDPGYYPIGGMQSFADNLVNAFQGYGGEIYFSNRVTKILTKNRVSKGVIIQDGTQIKGKAIVSNIDGTQTFQVLLDTKQTKESFSLKQMKPSLSVLILYMGLNTSIEKILKEKVTIWYADDYKIDNFFPRNKEDFLKNKFSLIMITFPSTHDPYLNHKNKDTIEAFSLAPYVSENFWKDSRNQLVESYFHKVKSIVPIPRKDIELQLSATPCTLRKYTRNREGAICGWSDERRKTRKLLLPQTTSVKGLFLAGHWSTVAVGGKGIPGVSTLGKNAALLVKDYLKKYA